MSGENFVTCRMTDNVVAKVLRAWSIGDRNIICPGCHERILFDLSKGEDRIKVKASCPCCGFSINTEKLIQK